MTADEEAAQAELFEIVAGLKGARFKLLGICSTLPESSPAREVAECILADAIAPAIRDLLSAAERMEEEETVDDP